MGVEVQVPKVYGVRYSVAELAASSRPLGPDPNWAQGSASTSTSCESEAGGFAEHTLTVCRVCAL